MLLRICHIPLSALSALSLARKQKAGKCATKVTTSCVILNEGNIK